MADQPSDAVRRCIVEFLATRGVIPPDAAPVFALLSGGNSHITWRVTHGAAAIVVKIAQPDGPLAPYDIGHEARMMGLAAGLGAAVPEVLGWHASSDGACDFLAMRHVAGASPSLWDVPAWLESGGPSFRHEVGRGLLRGLRPLHAWPQPDGEGMANHYRDWLAEARAKVEASAAGVLDLPPVVARAGDWLQERASKLDGPFALHHGDFRLGNAVFQGDRLAALLDWERAMPGHPFA